MTTTGKPTTNGDLRKLRAALSYLTSQPKPPKTAATGYNLFQLRLFRVASAYKPLMEALDATERTMVERYEKDAGAEAKAQPGGGVSFGRLDRAFDKEHAALMEAPIGAPEPEVTPLTMQEFNAQEIALPASVMEQMGKLLDTGAEADDS